MELPPIRLPQAPATPLPPIVTATVENVLAAHRYQLRIQGMLLELELSLTLAAGDKVPLRIVQQSPAGLVLEVLPREDRPPLARERAPRPEPDEVLRTLARQRAPLDPATIERVRALPPESRPAGAFLAGHGLEPVAALAQALARLDTPAVEASSLAPLLEPALRALLDRVAADPAEFSAKAPLSLLGAPAELEDALARALAASPRLQTLDRLIEGLSALAPKDVPPLTAQARALLAAATPDNAAEILSRLPPLPREAIRELLGELRELERLEIRALPELAQARAQRGTVLEAAERASAYRLLNQLSSLRGDGILLLEVPLRREDGRLTHLPLRVKREARGPGGDGSPGGISITLHAELARLGVVHAFLFAADRRLRVRLSARTREAVARLEEQVQELARALEELGFESTVSAQLAAPAARDSVFDVFAAPDEPREMDVQA